MTSGLFTARSGRPPAPPGGPAGRYLTNPGGYTAHLARLLLAALEHYGPAAGPLLAVAVTAVIAGRAYLRRRQHAAFAEAARQVTVLAPPQADPAGAEALWGHLTGLLRPAWARWWHGQPHLGWEYAWAGGDAAGMSIRLWVPGTIPPGLIERAVEAAWPGAHTVTAPASPPLPPGAAVAGGTLRLARPDILPLSTSGDPEAPLRALAGAAAGLAGGEHAVLQVLARPVTGARLRKARRAARKQRSGQSARLASRLLDLASPGSRHQPQPGRQPRRSRPGRRDPRDHRQARRAAVGNPDPLRGRHHRPGAGPRRGRPLGTAGRRRAAAGPAPRPGPRPRLGDRAADRAELARPQAAAPPRPARSAPAGSSRATCCRCRNSPRSPGCPPTRRCPAWPAPGHAPCRRRPPSRCPAPASAPSASPTPAQPRPVGLAVPDARHHLRIVGPTGVGKTTLIAGQILADAGAGRGVVFIDPKGDAVTDIIARLPEQAAGKVVLFDPGDRAAPPCLNVLQGDGSGTDTDMIVDNVTGIFRRIFAGYWGPRTDDIFRAACLTLLGSVPPGSGLVTLADIPPLLGDATVRKRLRPPGSATRS